eukprot:9234499-Alexandrium_andersonii.AAC.1
MIQAPPSHPRNPGHPHTHATPKAVHPPQQLHPVRVTAVVPPCRGPKPLQAFEPGTARAQKRPQN